MIAPNPTVMNLMLGRGRGGLEQAAVDYAQALAALPCPSLTVTSPDAWVNPRLDTLGLNYRALRAFAQWDPLAASRLGRWIKNTNTRMILCHGNRAFRLAMRAAPKDVTVIAVAHHGTLQRFGKADHLIATTHHAVAALSPLTSAPVSYVPNVVALPAEITRPTFRSIPVIGGMGRLVDKKGFETYVDALAILKQRGIPFHAMLGGTGTLEPALRERAKHKGIDSKITLHGWVEDKHAFFSALDIFVFPSLEEPFGIVLIEAMAEALPIVTSDADGPREITTGETAHMFPRGDATALANALEYVIATPEQARAMGTAARTGVAQAYTQPAMIEALRTILTPYLEAV